ncbi:DUF4145 domain-containing protein [Pedobacter immunditicola]|uniref:DUF4145 domain-containing protein n=1 Tax=Pedobacter immunditicola TaxID=3133440 RepID=UPI0030A39D04
MNKKYFCQKCNGARNHKALFELKKSGEEGYGSFQWIHYHRVIECLGCENISFLYVYGDSSMIREGEHGEPDYYNEEEIFPYHLTKGRELTHKYMIPQNIRNIYIETINAFKIKSLLLTAAGFRAIIEAICNHLKIKKANLEERINLLHDKGHLTKSESRRLHSIRFLGNSALHEIAIPKMEQLDILVDIINHLLGNLFINDKLMKDKLETVIDEYLEFVRIIQNLIKKDMVGREIELDEILGDSRKLISKTNYNAFKTEFVKDIKNGKYNFLLVVNDQKPTLSIISAPELVFYWE